MIEDSTEQSLVRKLVRTFHLNVEERDALPGGVARGSAVAGAIADAVREVGRFPVHVRVGDPYSGGVLEADPTGGFTIHWQAEIGYQRYATVRRELFADLYSAAEHLGKGEWPRDIDGVPLDWSA